MWQMTTRGNLNSIRLLIALVTESFERALRSADQVAKKFFFSQTRRGTVEFLLVFEMILSTNRRFAFG